MNPVDKILGKGLGKLRFDKTSNNFSLFGQERKTREEYWAALAELQKIEEQRRQEGRSNILPQKLAAQVVKEHNITGKNWHRWAPTGYTFMNTAPGPIQQPLPSYPFRQGELSPRMVTSPRPGLKKLIQPDPERIQQQQERFAMKGVKLKRIEYGERGAYHYG